jgi:hypothetical protein
VQTIHATAPIGYELLPDGAQATPNQRFILELYRDLLHRQADPAGLSAWTALLDRGASRSFVVRAIQTSPSNEYRIVEAESVYHQYLHRDADPSGLAGAIQLLAAGGTVEQLAALLAGSQEYFQARGGARTSGFLAALYQDALHRPIDAAGQAGATRMLAAGFSRQQLAATIFAGTEYALGRAASFYQEILDRPADPLHQAALATALQAGLPDELAIAVLAGSDEFFSK